MYRIKNFIFEKFQKFEKILKFWEFQKSVQEVPFNQLAQQDREWRMTQHIQVGCSRQKWILKQGCPDCKLIRPVWTSLILLRKFLNILKGSTLVSRNSQQRCASASLCRSKRSSANSFDMYRPSTANVLTRYRPSQARIHGQTGGTTKVLLFQLNGNNIRP